MLAWPFSSRPSRSRPTTRPELEELETRTACAVAVATVPTTTVPTAANVTGNTASITTIPGATGFAALPGALQVPGQPYAVTGAVPPGVFLNIDQGVDVSGGLLDGVRAAAGDLPNFDPTQAMFQLSSVPQLLNPTGRGLLGGFRSGGAGEPLMPVRPTTPDFRGLDGAIGLLPPAPTQGEELAAVAATASVSVADTDTALRPDDVWSN